LDLQDLVFVLFYHPGDLRRIFPAGRVLQGGVRFSFVCAGTPFEISSGIRREEVLLILAQLSVYPIGEGTSLGRFVKKGVAVIRDSGFKYEVGGLSTAIELPDLDALFDLVKRVHQAHLDEGARRIVIDLKVDDRRDKNATIETKRRSVT